MPEETWLIQFEDHEIRPEIFTDKAAALARYEQLKINWDCWLFVNYETAYATQARLEKAEARAKAAEDNLKWMCEQGCYMAHSKDGETCHLIWPYNRHDEEDDRPVVQKGAYGSHAEAIDAARSEAADGNPSDGQRKDGAP